METRYDNSEIPRKELIKALRNITDLIECYRFKLSTDRSDFDKYMISKETIKEIENIIYETL